MEMGEMEMNGDENGDEEMRMEMRRWRMEMRR